MEKDTSLSRRRAPPQKALGRSYASLQKFRETAKQVLSARDSTWNGRCGALVLPVLGVVAVVVTWYYTASECNPAH